MFNNTEHKADKCIDELRSYANCSKMSLMPNEISNSKIADAEWNFGVTASSSEIKVAGTTYQHLKLLVKSGNGASKTLHFEMTLPQFYSFLHELERAKSSLEYLT